MSLTRRQLLAAPAVLRAQDQRLNVLWLMTDEQRPDSLGYYRSSWAHSPNLDALASEGVLFENAYTPAPVCVPCRSSLLTGNYGSTLGVLHNQQRLRLGTRFLNWRFQDAGYQTASFGKKHYFIEGKQAFQTEAGRATDDVVDAERYPAGYDAASHDVVQYKGKPGAGPARRWILAGGFPASTEQSAEARNVNLCLDWLEKRDAAKPLLLRLSLNAPHTPVVTPAKYLDQVKSDQIPLPLPDESHWKHKPERESRALRAFQELAGLPSAGVEAPSLASFAREPAAAPVFSEIKFGYQGYRDDDRQVMIRDGDWKMSSFTAGTPDGALYNLKHDPGETNNLFADARHRPQIDRLNAILTNWDRTRRVQGETQ